MITTAPRISRLRRSQVPESTGAIYDRYMRTRGNVPNMFRTVAHRPEILETMIAHLEAILNTGTLTTKLKELVIVRTSQLNACEYCLASHSILATPPRMVAAADRRSRQLSGPRRFQCRGEGRAATRRAHDSRFDAHDRRRVRPLSRVL